MKFVVGVKYLNCFTVKEHTLARLVNQSLASFKQTSYRGLNQTPVHLISCEPKLPQSVNCIAMLYTYQPPISHTIQSINTFLSNKMKGWGLSNLPAHTTDTYEQDFCCNKKSNLSTFELESSHHKSYCTQPNETQVLNIIINLSPQFEQSIPSKQISKKASKILQTYHV